MVASRSYSILQPFIRYRCSESAIVVSYIPGLESEINPFEYYGGHYRITNGTNQTQNNCEQFTPSYARHQSNAMNSTFLSFVLGIAMINCFLTVVANLPASTIAVAVISKPGLYT